MATIIDALLITLGLDASNFKKGAAQAEKSTKDTAESVRKSAGEMTASLAEVGRGVAKLFLEFETAAGFIKWLGNLNRGEAELGRTAANLGISAHELNKWGLASELAGGKAEDMQNALGLMSKSLYDLQVKAQPNELIRLMQFLGMPVAGIKDNAKALQDLGDRLRVDAAQFGRQHAYNLAKDAGLNEGAFNFLIREKGERDEILRRAEEQNAVTEESVKRAQELQEAWRGIGQQITAAGQYVLMQLQPPVASLLKTVREIFDAFRDQGGLQGVATVFRTIADFAKAIADSVKYWSGLVEKSPIGKYNDWMFKQYGKAADWFHRMVGGDDSVLPSGNVDAGASAAQSGTLPTKSQLLAALAAAEAQNGIPQGALSAIANQESRFRPDIINGTTRSSAGATGLMQLMPGQFANAGADPLQDIQTAAKYLVQLFKQFGDWKLAIAAYNDGPGNIRAWLGGRHALPKETQDYVANVVGATPSLNRAAVAAGMIDRGNTTTVTTGDIIVNTQATDAQGVAQGVAGAIKRQVTLSQADTGQY